MGLLVRLILLPPLLVAAFNGMMGLFSPAYRQQEGLSAGWRWRPSPCRSR